MRVLSLVDKTKPTGRKDLRPERGLALHISSRSQQILFDTGISGVFYANACALGLEINRTTMAVLSHHHFDHGGGLKTFFRENQRAKVYLRRSQTEDFHLRILGLFRKRIGLDEMLFQHFPERFVFIERSSEIARGIFILTEIEKRHPMPKGNRHLFMQSGQVRQLDDFQHELLLVVQEGGSLVIFSGCSHHGILNMLDAAVKRFPGQPIKAVFGGLHLVDLPLFDTMAGDKADIEELGRSILKYPVMKMYTGHCTGDKAFQVLKEVMGSRLDYFATGSQVDI